MKKNSIKIIITIVLILLCVSFFGCKRKKNKNENVTIKFLVEEQVVLEKEVAKGYTLANSDFPSNPVKENYDFNGWFVSGLKISAGFVVNENTDAVAQFTEKKQEIKQDGSKEFPYLIQTPEDLINFADRINHIDEETEDVDYYQAHFALTNDIDMNGQKHSPIGQEVTFTDSNGVEKTIYGFMGEFDGRGHKISNLAVSINMRTNKTYLGGLFALTKMAYIHDLTLEDINYEVEAGSDDSERSIIMGGVVGQAILSVFENINVTGTINTKIFDNNGAYLGGIAGLWYVSDASQAYFAYARNCYTNVETTIGELEGEECSLESAVNGGLFGYVYNYSSAVAIINSITEGKVYGGKYVGGLVGYFASGNASILDSGSYASVYATGKEVSYTGGLAGYVGDDTIIKDCFFAGPVVRGTRSTSNYNSYAGGLVGYYTEDDYELYYTAGLACVNSYYNTTVRGANETSYQGIETEDTIDLEFVKTKLQWDENAWVMNGNILKGVPVDLKGKTYQVKLLNNGQVVQTITKDVNDILGIFDEPENNGSNIFFNWMLDDNDIYRSYMPVTKDIEIEAKYYDVSDIAGVYAGTWTLYETSDAGLMILNDDGTLQWVNSSTINGTYKYDGEHIILSMQSSLGEITGTLIDGSLEYIVSAGMSGDVSYQFGKIDLKLFGEYFSDSGDIITFSSEGNMSFQSTKILKGRNISGTYEQHGNELVVQGKDLSALYSSMSIVDNGDLTITVTFIAKGSSGVPSLENVVFRKIVAKDYSSYPFLGTYNFLYVSGSSPYYGTKYSLEFQADGTAIYRSRFSSVTYQYYAFNDGKTLKVIMEGNVSEFTYVEEGNFLHGIYNSGSGTSEDIRGVVLSPIADGEVYGLFITNVGNVLFVSENKHYYYFENGIYQPNANATINTIENNARITLNGKDYILAIDESQSPNGYGCYLLLVGEEEGDYTYNNQHLHLNGVDEVSGDISGTYQKYDDDLIVILTDNDEFIGFNLATAKANANVITLITPDAYQGVWFMDNKESSGEIEKDHYKLLIDGYGHATFMYLRYDETTGQSKYTFNWGGNGWVDITITATGISCDFNDYQHCEMSFYYDNNLMYSTEFGYLKEAAMHKAGYEGSMVPPVLPTTAEGHYVGEDSLGTKIILNLRQDLSGSYAGNPFSANYDGSAIVTFKVNNVTYRFNIKTLVLSYNNEEVTLRLDGEIEEVVPEALCGVWGNGTWEGMGADKTTTITIEKDGTVRYVNQGFINAVYDYDTNTLTATGLSAEGETISIEIIYNPETKIVQVNYKFVYNGEDYSVTGNNLSKIS